MFINKKIILSVLFIINFIFISNAVFSQNRASKGIINLKNFDFQNKSFAKLNGQWEFYWHKLLSPNDFKKKSLPKPTYLNVPGSWTDSFPTFGYGTYRLLVIINDKKDILSLKTVGASAAYKIWVNNKFVEEIGKVDTLKKYYIPKEKPLLYNFSIEDNKSDTVSIIIQVANFHHSKSGLWETIELGKSSKLYQTETKRNFLDALVIGILLIMAIYHLSLFILNKKSYDALFLAIFIIFMALRQSLTNNQLIYLFFPNLNYTLLLRLQFFTAFPNEIFAGLFFFFFFRKYFSNLIMSIITILSIIVTIIILFFQPVVFTSLLKFYALFLLVASIYYTYTLIKATKNKEQGALIALIGMLIMVGTGLFDIFSTTFVLGLPYIAAYGVVVFLFLQTYIITQKFTIALKKNIELNEQLSYQNINLENIVKSRTTELFEKIEELKTNEEELKQNNEELKLLYENIEQQKQIIQEKEQEFEDILSSIGEGVIITDVNENFLYANKTAKKIFGIEYGELIGRNLKEFIDDEEWTKIVIKTSRMRNAEQYSYEMKISLSNGQNKDLLVTAVPHEIKEKKTATLAIFRDITQRVKKEKEIYELKNRLEILINNLPAIIYFKDKNLKYQIVNNSFLRITKLSAKEIINKTDAEIFENNYYEKFENLDKKIFENNKAILNKEIEIIDNDKQPIWFSVSKVPVYDEKKQIQGIISIIYDITEEKKQKEILNKKNTELKKYFKAIEQSSLSIIFTDINGNIEYANPHFFQLTKYLPKDIIGKNINILKSDKNPPELLNDLWKKIKHGHSWQGEFITIKKDGSEFLEKCTMSPIFDDNNNISSFVAIKEDITKLKEVQKKIENKNQQFRNTINNMVDVYVKCNLEGQFIDASPSIVNEFGAQSLDEVINTKIFDWVIASEEEKNRFFLKLLQNNSLKNYRFKFKQKNSIIQFAEINASIFYIDGKPAGFEGIIRNMTERIKFEQELNKRNKIIAQSHKEIKASIQYAKHIQNALFPHQSILNKFFKENFIIFMPKEAVSGDFYYFKKINSLKLFGVADCTGHGVAGGFLTMLSITLLEEIVRTTPNINPAIVLDKLRYRIKNIFSGFGRNNNNGLDMALCLYDEENKVLHYAGANNPMFLLRNKKIIEYKPTKNPVGKFIAEQNFENHIIKIKNNDIIYLFSDGYTDQFGGPKQLKFSKKQFKKLLETIHEFPMHIQKELLEESIQEWKNNTEQIDDITVLGIKINYQE
jgi:PAS domain S-box-containing protein